MRRKKPNCKKNPKNEEREKNRATKAEIIVDSEILEQGWNRRLRRLEFQRVGRRNGEIWHSNGGVVPRNFLMREISVEFFPNNRKVL